MMAAASAPGSLNPVARLLAMLRLILRREGSNLIGIVGHSLLLPAFICYAAFMIAPNSFETRQSWVLGGIVLALGMTSLTQVHFAVTSDRLLGGLRLFSALGVDDRLYTAAYLAYGTMMALLVSVTGGAVMIWTGLAPGNAARLPELLLVGTLAGLVLASLGVLTGLSVRSFSMGDTVINLLGLVLVLVSPVFYQANALPAWLAPIGWASPYTHIAALASALANGAQLDPASIVALALMGLLLLGLVRHRQQRGES